MRFIVCFLVREIIMQMNVIVMYALLPGMVATVDPRRVPLVVIGSTFVQFALSLGIALSIPAFYFSCLQRLSLHEDSTVKTQQLNNARKPS